jgi:hypothetical protein
MESIIADGLDKAEVVTRFLASRDTSRALPRAIDRQ